MVKHGRRGPISEAAKYRNTAKTGTRQKCPKGMGFLAIVPG